MVMFSLCLNTESTRDQSMTKNRPRLSLRLRLGGLQASQNVWRFVQECISMATLVCAHSTAILTNRGPSELVAEAHPLCPPGKDMDYKKNDHPRGIIPIQGRIQDIRLGGGGSYV